MKKLSKNILFLSSLLFLSIFLFSCGGKEGYSAVLWSIPEYNIQDGDIVPVYSKSNIIHKYIIGTPNGEKIEIPLWQLTEPSSKRKAKKNYNLISEYNHKYAKCKLDGLPCRAEPKNLAKQVYRLRKGEILKILSKGEGDPVKKGKEELEGDWYRVLTKDGTLGWCFSYNLVLYDIDENGNQVGGTLLTDVEIGDSTFEGVFDKQWFPQQYKRIVDSENIDTTVLKMEYGFTIDTEKGKISINVPENKVNKIKAFKDTWDYSGYEKTGRNQYKLIDLPVVITTNREDLITVRYTGSSGKPQDFQFITLEEDLEEIIKIEKERRSDLFSKIVSMGPDFVSSSYGNLNISMSYSFTWTGYSDVLKNAVIPAEAKSTGTILYKYVVDKRFANQYDGVLTFKFDGASSEEINFLFKVESDGIRLEDAKKATFVDGRVTERSQTPLVLYFKAN